MNSPLEDILALRNSAIFVQSANGYRQYRTKIAHRVAKCRKRLKIEQKPTKGSKVLKRKTISSDDIAENVEFARVYLLLAERAWAHAMEAKAVLELTDSRSKKKHVVSKLAKAAKYMTQLTGSIDDAPLSQVAKLEVYTYESLILGSLAFEQHNWPKALKHFSASKVGLQVLSTRDIAESSKELIRDLITTVVDSSLTYAAYQSKEARSVDIPTLAKQIVGKNGAAQLVSLINSLDRNALNLSKVNSSTAELGTITWRAHSAQVQDPDLASSILAAQKLDAELEASPSAEVSAFDQLLQAWQEAADVAKESIDRIESAESVTRHDQQKQQLYIVFTYIRYTLLLRRIQRDTILLRQLTQRETKSTHKKLEVNRDMVRLYDTILQSSGQLLELSGVHNDDDLFDSLTAFNQYFKLKRTCLIAHSYRLTGDFKSSLALYDLAKQFIATESPRLKVELPGHMVSEKDIEQAVTEHQKELSRAHGMAAFQDLTKRQPDQEYLSVTESLDRYPRGTPEEVLNNLVNLKPKLRPVPLKPVFYDIAYNFLNFEGTPTQATQSTRKETTEKAGPTETASHAAQEKKKGFFGSFWGKK